MEPEHIVSEMSQEREGCFRKIHVVRDTSSICMIYIRNDMPRVFHGVKIEIRRAQVLRVHRYHSNIGFVDALRCLVKSMHQTNGQIKNAELATSL